jgi:expansin (peptidoglycan-binding protein)
MGITDKGLHRIDPRIGKKAFQYTHDYRRQKKFSHITTTVEGWIAVGSREGDIRLYPTEQKQWATSKFAGLGDPVLALETTKDQRWLLVTYKTYLLLLPTFMGESSLFHKKTIIDNRPLAKKLTIKP